MLKYFPVFLTVNVPHEFGLKEEERVGKGEAWRMGEEGKNTQECSSLRKKLVFLGIRKFLSQADSLTQILRMAASAKSMFLQFI